MKDNASVLLTYWPIFLEEGQSSDDLPFSLDGGVPTNARLSASYDPRVKVWCSYRTDAGGRSPTYAAFVDISVTPIDLSLLVSYNNYFKIHIEALSPIVGLERVPITVVAGMSSAAGWVM